MSSKNLGLTGILIAFTVALPLFVWTAINVNFNLNKRADEDPPNFCGGTCGSNYNCQANFFCFIENGKNEGFCRNPICKDKADCICNTATASATSIAKVTPTKTATSVASPTTTASSIPKGGDENFGSLVSETPKPMEPTQVDINESQTIENQFFNKYAVYLFGAFVLIIILSIFYVVKKNRNNNIPHIMPPTNI